MYFFMKALLGLCGNYTKGFLRQIHLESSKFRRVAVVALCGMVVLGLFLEPCLHGYSKNLNVRDNSDKDWRHIWEFRDSEVVKLSAKEIAIDYLGNEERQLTAQYDDGTVEWMIDDQSMMESTVCGNTIKLKGKRSGKTVVKAVVVDKLSIRHEAACTVNVTRYDEMYNIDSLQKDGINICDKASGDKHIHIWQNSGEILGYAKESAVRVGRDKPSMKENKPTIKNLIIDIDNIKISPDAELNEVFSPIRIMYDVENLTINVIGDNYLKSQGGAAALYIAYNSSINITGSGSLIADSRNAVNDEDSNGAAGIGSDADGYMNGAVTVNMNESGKIVALGGGNNSKKTEYRAGAGIGSGYDADYSPLEVDGSYGKITINSGQVNASGQYDAAGIGSGSMNKATCINQKIEINRANVIALGRGEGAGIGGGRGSAFKSIKINAGIVTAVGGIVGLEENVTSIGPGIGAGAGSFIQDTASYNNIEIMGEAQVYALGGITHPELHRDEKLLGRQYGPVHFEDAAALGKLMLTEGNECNTAGASGLGNGGSDQFAQIILGGNSHILARGSHSSPGVGAPKMVEKIELPKVTEPQVISSGIADAQETVDQQETEDLEKSDKESDLHELQPQVDTEELQSLMEQQEEICHGDMGDLHEPEKKSDLRELQPQDDMDAEVLQESEVTAEPEIPVIEDITQDKHEGLAPDTQSTVVVLMADNAQLWAYGGNSSSKICGNAVSANRFRYGNTNQMYLATTNGTVPVMLYKEEVCLQGVYFSYTTKNQGAAKIRFTSDEKGIIGEGPILSGYGDIFVYTARVSDNKISANILRYDEENRQGSISAIKRKGSDIYSFGEGEFSFAKEGMVGPEVATVEEKLLATYNLSERVQEILIEKEYTVTATVEDGINLEDYGWSVSPHINWSGRGVCIRDDISGVNPGKGKNQYTSKNVIVLGDSTGGELIFTIPYKNEGNPIQILQTISNAKEYSGALVGSDVAVVGYVGEDSTFEPPPYVEVDGIYRLVTKVGASYNGEMIPIELKGKVNKVDLGKLAAGYTVAQGAFYGNKSLTNVVGVENCTAIGNYAFYGCTGLKTISDLSLCEVIGHSTFEEAISLESVENLSNCCKIGDSAFMFCRSLCRIDLPSTKSIGNKAFAGDKDLILTINVTNDINVGSDHPFGSRDNQKYLPIKLLVMKSDKMKTLQSAYQANKDGKIPFQHAVNKLAIVGEEISSNGNEMAIFEGLVGKSQNVASSTYYISSKVEKEFPIKPEGRSISVVSRTYEVTSGMLDARGEPVQGEIEFNAMAKGEGIDFKITIDYNGDSKVINWLERSGKESVPRGIGKAVQCGEITGIYRLNIDKIGAGGKYIAIGLVNYVVDVYFQSDSIFVYRRGKQIAERGHAGTETRIDVAPVSLESTDNATSIGRATVSSSMCPEDGGEVFEGDKWYGFDGMQNRLILVNKTEVDINSSVEHEFCNGLDIMLYKGQTGLSLEEDMIQVYTSKLCGNGGFDNDQIKPGEKVVLKGLQQIGQEAMYSYHPLYFNFTGVPESFIGSNRDNPSVIGKISINFSR